MLYRPTVCSLQLFFMCSQQPIFLWFAVLVSSFTFLVTLLCLWFLHDACRWLFNVLMFLNDKFTVEKNQHGWFVDCCVKKIICYGSHHLYRIIVSVCTCPPLCVCVCARTNVCIYLYIWTCSPLQEFKSLLMSEGTRSMPPSIIISTSWCQRGSIKSSPPPQRLRLSLSLTWGDFGAGRSAC